MLIMAILIISAAEPCMGALMAFRSAKPRTVCIGRVNIAQVPAAAHQGGYITVFAGKVHGIGHVLFNTRVLGKVLLNDIGSLFTRDAQIL
jgi:hypothetical protein